MIIEFARQVFRYLNRGNQGEIILKAFDQTNHKKRQKYIKHKAVISVFCLLLVVSTAEIFPRFKSYSSLAHLQQLIELPNVNDLLGERIVFQQINMKNEQGKWLKNTHFHRDDHIAVLLYIDAARYYLFKDGAEDDWSVRLRYKNFSDAYANYRNQGILFGRLRKQFKNRNLLLAFLPEEHPLVDEKDQDISNEIYQYDPIYRSAIIERKYHENQLIAHLENRGYVKGKEYRELESKISVIENNINARLANYREFVDQEIIPVATDKEQKAAKKTPVQEKGEKKGENEFSGQEILFPPVSAKTFKEKISQNNADGKIDSITIVTRNARRTQINVQEIAGSADTVKINPSIQQMYDTLKKQHIQKYAELFREVIKNSIRVPISSETTRIVFDSESCGAPGEDSEKVVFGWRIRLFASDHTEYLVEDCNGDGITETFLAWTPDYFNWGDENIPNALIIYNNKDQDIKDLIGDLVTVYRTLGYDPKKKESDVKKILETEAFKARRDQYLKRSDFRDLN